MADSYSHPAPVIAKITCGVSLWNVRCVGGGHYMVTVRIAPQNLDAYEATIAVYNKTPLTSKELFDLVIKHLT